MHVLCKEGNSTMNYDCLPYCTDLSCGIIYCHVKLLRNTRRRMGYLQGLLLHICYLHFQTTIIVNLSLELVNIQKLQQSNQTESSSNFVLDCFDALLGNWVLVVVLSIFIVKLFISLLCSDTGCPDRRYSWVFSVIPDK